VSFATSVEGQLLALHFFAKVGSITSTPSIVLLTIDIDPEVPQGLVTTAFDTRVLVKWNRNSESDIKEYNVFRDGNLVPLRVVSDPGTGATVEFLDFALTNGREYQYQVEAVDQRGNRSGLSDPVSSVPIAGLEWGP